MEEDGLTSAALHRLVVRMNRIEAGLGPTSLTSLGCVHTQTGGSYPPPPSSKGAVLASQDSGAMQGVREGVGGDAVLMWELQG